MMQTGLFDANERDFVNMLALSVARFYPLRNDFKTSLFCHLLPDVLNEKSIKTAKRIENSTFAHLSKTSVLRFFRRQCDWPEDTN